MVIIGLFYDIANLGRSKRERSYELFLEILPQYYQKHEMHLYYELMDEILDSHHLKFEKDRIDK